jgi:DNA-binding beta-propeller fold protein YncE
MQLPDHVDITCILSVHSGEVLIATKSALLHKVNNCFALIAGHPNETGFKDGNAFEARFNGIYGLAMERGGSVLVSDCLNNSVRRVSPHGQVTTVAGNGEEGFADGVGAAARFNWPHGIDVDSQGLIYVADTCNHCIRTVQPADGTVSTLCGKGEEEGCVNGPAAEARFNLPSGLALDMNEDLIVADNGNHNVRKVALPDGSVTKVAGGMIEDEEDRWGCTDGEGPFARFDEPVDVAVDGSNSIIVADRDNNCVRKISGKTGVVTTIWSNLEFYGYYFPSCIAIHGEKLVVVTNTESTPTSPYPKDAVSILHGAVVPRPPQPGARYHIDQAALLALQADYGSLLEDHSRADVSFAVDGGVVYAHRVILAARSEYLRGLLANGCDPIPISGIPAPEFKAVLRFLYTHKLPPMAAFTPGMSLCSIACAAKSLQATGLYDLCFTQFVEFLSVHEVMYDLLEAHRRGLPAFQEAALAFIRGNAENLSEGCLDLLHALGTSPESTALAVRVAKTLGQRLIEVVRDPTRAV